MSRRRGPERDANGLTSEDRRIWARVAGTVAPPKVRKAQRVPVAGPEIGTPAEPATRNYTNEMRPRPLPEPDPLMALRTRIRRLLDGTEPADPAPHDLAAAMLALRLPGAPPYHGPLDLAELDRAMEPCHLDGGTLARLARLLPDPPASPLRARAA